ncbi:MAG TPA: hypothetical protein PK625_09405, partial [Spirochaetales bacterium]|nr:hypothetical protein [Spirochaetales bacterium]
MIRRMLAVTILLFAAQALSAQTVSVELWWTGEGRESLSACILNGAMDALFDAGYIATNESGRQADQAAFRAYVPEPAASEGYVDYVVLALAVYASGDGDEARPPLLSYRVLAVATGTELASGELVAPEPEDEGADAVQAACRGLGKARIFDHLSSTRV